MAPCKPHVRQFREPLSWGLGEDLQHAQHWRHADPGADKDDAVVPLERRLQIPVRALDAQRLHAVNLRHARQLRCPWPRRLHEQRHSPRLHVLQRHREGMVQRAQLRNLDQHVLPLAVRRSFLALRPRHSNVQPHHARAVVVLDVRQLWLRPPVRQQPQREVEHPQQQPRKRHQDQRVVVQDGEDKHTQEQPVRVPEHREVGPPQEQRRNRHHHQEDPRQQPRQRTVLGHGAVPLNHLRASDHVSHPGKVYRGKDEQRRAENRVHPDCAFVRAAYHAGKAGMLACWKKQKNKTGTGHHAEGTINRFQFAIIRVLLQVGKKDTCKRSSKRDHKHNWHRTRVPAQNRVTALQRSANGDPHDHHAPKHTPAPQVEEAWSLHRPGHHVHLREGSGATGVLLWSSVERATGEDVPLHRRDIAKECAGHFVDCSDLLRALIHSQ